RSGARRRTTRSRRGQGGRVGAAAMAGAARPHEAMAHQMKRAAGGRGASSTRTCARPLGSSDIRDALALAADVTNGFKHLDRDFDRVKVDAAAHVSIFGTFDVAVTPPGGTPQVARDYIIGV